MQTVFIWIGTALAVVFASALAVAAWEHYRLLAGRLQAWPELPPSDHGPLETNVAVDFNLDVDGDDTLPLQQGDSSDRRAALERTLGRLAQAPKAASAATAAPKTAVAVARPSIIKPPASRPLAWVDTEPMVGPGTRAEPTYPQVKA